MPIAYKSFCWKFGNTSFRTRNFNKTIEEQLALLDEFWSLAGQRAWRGESDTQSRYYDFMKRKGFVVGSAANKPKDAREKTSGLEDFGLVDANRRLTEAGAALLAISRSGDFSTDNFFEIPRDSALYLRQLLKVSCDVNGSRVRPFLVFLYVLAQVGRLSRREFTYLLPLCTDPEATGQIVAGIRACRSGTATMDELLLARLMGMENYREALALFLNAEAVDRALLCEIGMNRKSRSYDANYLPLFQELHAFYLEGEADALSRAHQATNPLKLKSWWRDYLFRTTSQKAIRENPLDTIKPTLFDAAHTERDFREAFFWVMHLCKAKSTLSDYQDLNRRYVQTSDIVLFQDGYVELDIVPRHFFRSAIGALYQQAYLPSQRLHEDCPLEEIAPCLRIDAQEVIDSVNAELGTAVHTIEEAHRALDKRRYLRLHHLLDTRFTPKELGALLQCFEQRMDAEIEKRVTDNADIPTIFEYILGLAWYSISGRQGRLLDYMKLSLDAGLLPKTHAAGGEADIVYEYGPGPTYPAHTLLLEATLADGTNQRRMEMEPVSRHLGQRLLRSHNPNDYCVFVTTALNINVVSDFRMRKNGLYYDPADGVTHVDGMKIIPLSTADLAAILSTGKGYGVLYPLFDRLHASCLPPHLWQKELTAQLAAR